MTGSREATGAAGRTSRRPPGGSGPLKALVVASVLTLALDLVPEAAPLARPLMLISTVVHEFGHGLTAMLLGGHFAALYIWPDGSGRALYLADFGRLRQALVAAGGLLGPSLLSWALFIAGRDPRSARRALGLSALMLLVIEVVWVRNAFAAIYVGLGILILGLLTRRASPLAAQTGVVFLAVQLALSVFSRADYLFMQTAFTGNGTGLSDTAQIQRALWLPYWLWGALIAIASVGLLWHGLRTFAASMR